MSNENVSDHEQVPSPETGPEEAGTGTQSQRNGRRGFLKGAAAGSVLFSVSGRPAWANNCSMSGMMSGNLSTQEEPCDGGEGCSPGFWKTHPGLWHDQFPPTDSFKWGPFKGSTLWEVINKSAEPEGTFTDDKQFALALKNWGFHVVAAVQNASTTVDFGMTVFELEDKVSKDWKEAQRQINAELAKEVIEASKDELDALNNQGCPL